MTITRLDHKIIYFFRRIMIPASRIALFVIFFWFGLLKVLGFSPATPLVSTLFQKTISFMPFAEFLVLFGLFEMLIGVLFLIPKATRITIPLLAIHMATTVLPLFMLPKVAWTSWFVPTLEGQYIIKNLVLIAAAIGIAAHMVPLDQQHKRHSVREG